MIMYTAATRYSGVHIHYFNQTSFKNSSILFFSDHIKCIILDPFSFLHKVSVKYFQVSLCQRKHYLALGFYVLFLLYLLYFMCTNVLPTCMPAHHLHAWCPRRLAEGVRIPGAGVTDGSSLQEKQILATA